MHSIFDLVSVLNGPTFDPQPAASPMRNSSTVMGGIARTKRAVPLWAHTNRTTERHYQVHRKSHHVYSHVRLSE
jgi:hypothetical protein